MIRYYKIKEDTLGYFNLIKVEDGMVFFLDGAWKHSPFYSDKVKSFLENDCDELTEEEVALLT